MTIHSTLNRFAIFGRMIFAFAKEVKMTDVEITGRCFCGAVQFCASGEPKCVAICYCDDCTRAVGSELTVWAQFPADRFRFTQGEPTRFESSPGVTRTFCPRCGTSLTYHYKDGSQVDVTTAALDDRKAFPPRTEGGDKPLWLEGLANKPSEATSQ
jgi:hypothetical protein